MTNNNYSKRFTHRIYLFYTQLTKQYFTLKNRKETTPQETNIINYERNERKRTIYLVFYTYA